MPSCVALRNVKDMQDEVLQRVAPNTFPKPNGFVVFENLKNVVKKGEKFSKAVEQILEEREALEVMYAKRLKALATKLSKTTASSFGTEARAFTMLADVFQREADVHAHYAVHLTENVQKPMKQLVAVNHHRRKQIEHSVDGCIQQLAHASNHLGKAKDRYSMLTSEADYIQSQISSNHITEKVVKKLNKSLEKAIINRNRAEDDYIKRTHFSNSARFGWIVEQRNALNSLHDLEQERLIGMRNFLSCWSQAFTQHVSEKSSLIGCVNEASCATDVDKDLTIIAKSNISEAEKVITVDLIESSGCDFETMFHEVTEQVQLINCMINRLVYEKEHEETRVFEGERMQRLTEAGDEDGATNSLHPPQQQQLNSLKVLIYDCSLHLNKIALAKMSGDLDCDRHELDGFIASKEDSQQHATVLHLPIQIAIEKGIFSYDFVATPNRPNAHHGETFLNGGGEKPVIYTPPDSPEEDETTGNVLNKSFYPPPTVFADEKPLDEVWGIGDVSAVEYVRVEYAYAARDDSEIDLFENDVIRVIERNEDSWWLGERGGDNRQGLFPANFTIPLRYTASAEEEGGQ